MREESQIFLVLILRFLEKILLLQYVALTISANISGISRNISKFIDNIYGKRKTS